MVILNDTIKRNRFKYALFDFDGTISLFRAGWQDVMKPYFVEVLSETPQAESIAEIQKCVNDFVDYSTGKQTIYQCIELAEQITQRGGKALEPIEYKKEYLKRLLDKIHHRLDGVEQGIIKPDRFLVEGAVSFLENLCERGITLFLASGTDEPDVQREARLLGIDSFFKGGIFGAKADYKRSSKKAVIQSILSDNQLSGYELLGFGDGFVEIENVKEVGGCAVGIATDERQKGRMDQWKVKRLTDAGADILVQDFSEKEALEQYLFTEE